ALVKQTSVFSCGAYFVSFYLLTDTIILNLLVALVLEAYDQEQVRLLNSEGARHGSLETMVIKKLATSSFMQRHEAVSIRNYGVISYCISGSCRTPPLALKAPTEDRVRTVRGRRLTAAEAALLRAPTARPAMEARPRRTNTCVVRAKSFQKLLSITQIAVRTCTLRIPDLW
ncbi:unnamed protein product, partial [Rangifer tarandus platyrhynchus]